MYKSDILIHPTYVDTFGVVVLEAIAHGLGIISTDLYALPEMVYDGVNGIILMHQFPFGMDILHQNIIKIYQILKSILIILIHIVLKMNLKKVF